MVALHARPGRVGDLLDEGGGLGLPADHLVLGGVGGPGRVAEQPGQLGAAGEHPREHLQVGRVGPLPLQAPEPLPQGGAPGPGHHRHVVGGVGGDRHLAVGAGRPRPQPVLGQAGQLRRVDAQLLHVVADVAPELLPDAHQLVAQRAHPRPGGLVAVHAGAPEVAQALLDQEARGGVGAGEVHAGERLVQPAVEREPGLEGVDLLLVPLGGVPDLGGGVDVAQQAGLGGGVPEPGEGVVEEPERLVAGERPSRRGAARPSPRRRGWPPGPSPARRRH